MSEKGQLWVVFIFLCKIIELFEFILGQEQRVCEAVGNVTDRSQRGILHVLLAADWSGDR